MQEVRVSKQFIDDLVRKVSELERAVRELQVSEYTQYKGTKGSNFNTTDLPDHGDYGFQTATNTVHMNCNGVIRNWTTNFTL